MIAFRLWALCLAGAALLAAGSIARGSPGRDGAPGWPDARAIAWPAATETLAFDNIEGIVLLRAQVYGGSALAAQDDSSSTRSGVLVRDTTGWFALDTGAGFLALDARLAVGLGISDSLPQRSLGLADRPLARLKLAGLALDQVSPVVLFQSPLLSRVTGRDVLGLIGHNVLRDRILWVDYEAGRIALVPAGPSVETEDASAIAESRRLLGPGLSPGAVPCRFRITEDGKILLRARFTPRSGGPATPWLTLALDTGASKTTLFEDVVEPLARTRRWRPVMRGLVAPTMSATSKASLSRVRRVEVRGSARDATASDVEVALLRNPLADQLAAIAGEPVYGLLGYTFLEQFRLACDYPRRVLWLDPVPHFRDAHPLRHTHVGIQVERDHGKVRIVAVVEGSPSARAGIAPGDEVVAVDGAPASDLALAEVTRRLEGRPGTMVTLTIRRGESERTYHLRRRRLL